MRVLIDGDIIAYRTAWACQMRLADYLSNGVVVRTELVKGDIVPDPREAKHEVIVYYQLEDEETVYKTIDATLDNIMYYIETAYEPSTKDIYLTDQRNNYRKQIDTEYKGNRRGAAKPLLLSGIMKYLKTKHNAKVARGEEADDRLGIEQCKGKDSTVIVTTDKDLLMIPGLHYNHVKNEFRYVSPEEGQRTFWTQMIMGDSTDNIKGVPGIGPKKAAKAVEDCSTEQEYCQAAYSVYLQYYQKEISDVKKAEEKAKEEFIKNGRLIWIRQKEGQIWSPPTTL